VNAALPTPSVGAGPGLAAAKLITGADYRESLRRYKPTVHVDGRLIDSVADAPSLQPGINALAFTYDFALDPAVPYAKRIEVARFIEDLTASYQGGWYSVISLHGGGSPAAMKQEIWRNYPVGNKVDLVERLLDRGVLHDETRAITKNRQPGRCCDTGCTQPGQPVMVALPATTKTGSG